MARFGSMGGGVRVCVLLCALFVMAMVVDARPSPLFAITDGGEEVEMGALSYTGRKLFKLVSNTVVLPYHNGPLLGGAGALNVYIVWYGTFSLAQKAIVTDFFASFQQPGAEVHASVASWWKLTSGYKDSKNGVPDGLVKVAGEVDDNYSMGKALKRADIETLVVNSLGALTADPASMYFLLTAADVEVEGFCMNSCASHSFSLAKNFMLPYAWVGNSGTQCPGQCAWPYALPQYGPQGAKALVAPNADAGMDGMVINMATMLAGTVTNPFNNGYYQGDASAPLEAATACTGIYGAGAYPGNPGHLTVDPITRASYNAQGVGSRKYLLPALWDPTTLTCTPVP
jgi:hypothetical protein